MTSYAGIGSRSTPQSVRQLMTLLACKLGSRGYILRSGAAPGADQAFERGAVMCNAEREIFIPWDGFEGRKANEPSVYTGVSDSALQLAATLHPSWERCSPGARALHGRNCYQILGIRLNAPVEFVLCWTPGGKGGGGTGQAVRLARQLDIPVLDLGIYNESQIQAFTKLF